MAFNDKITTSLYGRRFGLQNMTTGITGGSSAAEFLVGPQGLRPLVSTSDTTSANIAAYGVSFITSAVSSGVYTLDPPIPGVRKTLNINSTSGTVYIKTANGETFTGSTQGTSFPTIKSTQNNAGVLELIGLTTAVWGIVGGALSSGTYVLSATT